jgi:hypothetical protein
MQVKEVYNGLSAMFLNVATLVMTIVNGQDAQQIRIKLTSCGI